MFVPALLAGNAVLYKPSEFASLTGLEIARLLHESGVPEDVFMPVIGGGRRRRRAACAQDVDGVFFTGSVRHRAAHRASRARARMVKLQLELGGKDPVYVCDDVDVAKAAAAHRRRRVLQHRPELLLGGAHLRERDASSSRSSTRSSPKCAASGAAIPTDERTYIGPLTRAPQLQVLEAQVTDARRKGAKVLAGGERVKAPGNWFEPTVLVDVNHSHGRDARRELRPGDRPHAGAGRRRGACAS